TEAATDGCKLSRQIDQSSLGRHVADRPGRADLALVARFLVECGIEGQGAIDRTDVDDPPAARTHGIDGADRYGRRSLQIELNFLPPPEAVELERRSRFGAAGTVDEKVEATKALDDLPDEAVLSFSIG